VGRPEIDCYYILESGHHSEILRMWGMDPGSVLGNPLPAGCVSLQLDRLGDGEHGGGGTQDAERGSVKEQNQGGVG
jgi:hypothetical protein